jgi:hypothetical protein
MSFHTLKKTDFPIFLRIFHFMAMFVDQIHFKSLFCIKINLILKIHHEKKFHWQIPYFKKQYSEGSTKLSLFQTLANAGKHCSSQLEGLLNFLLFLLIEYSIQSFNFVAKTKELMTMQFAFSYFGSKSSICVDRTIVFLYRQILGKGESSKTRLIVTTTFP